MLLCIDVGNTQIHGAVFTGGSVGTQFRKSTHPFGSSDELGLFFRSALRENGAEPRDVSEVAVCCVVPAALYDLKGAVEKYFGIRPFVLQAGVKTGLKIRYRNPLEVGADRIAGAIGAVERHPARDLIVVDCGTATTFDVVSAAGDYLGGAILPGVAVAAESLASRTAKLPRVEIAVPEAALGRTTSESIQAGIFHGHVGAIRQLVDRLTAEAFPVARPVVIGTGGFARLFADERLFDEVVPELVLLGLRRAVQLNRNTT